MPRPAAESAPPPRPDPATAWHCAYCGRKLMDCVLTPGSWIVKLCPKCGQPNVKHG